MTYGMKGAPIVGGGFPGSPWRSSGGRGEVTWATPGTFFWTVPDDFPWDEVSVCLGGGGGGASGNGPSVSSGAAGGFAWRNNIPVLPGMVIRIDVGAAGRPGVFGSATATAGGMSQFMDSTTCAASGGGAGLPGITAVGGVMLAGDGGGKGGNGAFASGAGSNGAAASGGAAGGYQGNGGNGVASGGGGLPGNSGTGGAAGSGAVEVTGTTAVASGSGGIGIFGQGASGAGAASFTSGGQGGSGGEIGAAGLAGLSNTGRSGLFCAGGGVCSSSNTASIRAESGLPGFVRIVFGHDVAFPSTNVGPG